MNECAEGGREKNDKGLAAAETVRNDSPLRQNFLSRHDRFVIGALSSPRHSQADEVFVFRSFTRADHQLLVYGGFRIPSRLLFPAAPLGVAIYAPHNERLNEEEKQGSRVKKKEKLNLLHLPIYLTQSSYRVGMSTPEVRLHWW